MIMTARPTSPLAQELHSWAKLCRELYSRYARIVASGRRAELVEGFILDVSTSPGMKLFISGVAQDKRWRPHIPAQKDSSLRQRRPTGR